MFRSRRLLGLWKRGVDAAWASSNGNGLASAAIVKLTGELAEKTEKLVQITAKNEATYFHAEEVAGQASPEEQKGDIADL